MPISPHFSLPFRFVQTGISLSVAVSEEDTPEEIFDCAQAVIRTNLNKRVEMPEFGTPDQAFSLGGVDAAAIVAACIRWEPRADVVLEQDRSKIDQLIVIATANIHAGPFNEGPK